MKTFSAQIVAAWTVLLACASACPAGILGKAAREAAEAAGRRSGRVAREGLEALTEKGAGRLGAKGVNGGALIVRASDDVARPILATFGDDGARALRSLSPRGAERLAAMSDELAAGGRGQEWMQLIGRRGDEVTDWLWQRRGSVAVGTVATAVLLQPDDFLQASERIASTTIHAAGEYVAGPIVERAASAIPWGLFWLVVLVVGISWFLAKRKFAGLRRGLLAAGFQAPKAKASSGNAGMET